MSGYADVELLEEQYWEDWGEKWMEDRERRETSLALDRFAELDKPEVVIQTPTDT